MKFWFLNSEKRTIFAKYTKNSFQRGIMINENFFFLNVNSLFFDWCFNYTMTNMIKWIFTIPCGKYALNICIINQHIFSASNHYVPTFSNSGVFKPIRYICSFHFLHVHAYRLFGGLKRQTVHVNDCQYPPL